MRRLYLDNAATSFPKPPGVIDAMVSYATTVGASPGRGQYAESREGAAVIRRCRERLARLLNAEDPSRIVFTLNTTDALNLAIKGVVRGARLRGMSPASLRVVTTAMDHNSVLRPFHALAEEGVRVDHVPADATTGIVSPADVARVLDDGPPALLLAANMASNVGGTIQPVAEFGRLCRARGVLFLVDAAQALGHIPVRVSEIQPDLLAFPGHKGLLGPQGTGGLYLRPGVEEFVATTREGGTGSWSEHDEHPRTMPERYEAGSHNTAGLAGLAAAAEWILAQGVDALRAHELDLITLTLRRLRELGVRHPDWPMGDALGDAPCAAMRLVGPADPAQRVGVFALAHDDLDPAEIAAILDTRFGILVRTGLTCAPGAHRTFGTLSGGVVRFSFGPFLTRDDVHTLSDALRQVCVAHAPAAANSR